MRLEILVDRPYDFARSVQDYGWVALAPFRWHEDQQALHRVERLESGQVVLLRMSAIDTADCRSPFDKLRTNGLGDGVTVLVDVEAGGSLQRSDESEILQKVRWMLRLDEDLSSFYERCAANPSFMAAVGTGRGRLLRSPAVFEDVVKTICTTNITWSQTKSMVDRLVQTLGDPLPLDPCRHAFPTPAQVASASDEVFRGTIRMGYRGPYVQQLAREIVEGTRDLEALKVRSLTALELKRTLKDVKGVGDYAAHTLMMLLGYYGELAIDTEMRRFVAKTFFEGKSPTDQDIQALYEGWGEWKYLAYWFEFAWSWSLRQTPVRPVSEGDSPWRDPVEGRRSALRPS